MRGIARTGLILGIVASAVSATAIIFSAISLLRTR